MQITYRDILDREPVKVTDDIWHLLEDLTGLDTLEDLVSYCCYKPHPKIKMVTYFEESSNKWYESLSFIHYGGLPVALVETEGLYSTTYNIKPVKMSYYNEMVDELKKMYSDVQEEQYIDLGDEYHGSFYEELIKRS